MNRPHICVNFHSTPGEHGHVHGQSLNIMLGAEGQTSPKAHTLVIAAPIPMCDHMHPQLSQYKITPLCPHVSAANHCLHWLTPYGLKYLNSLSGHLLAELITRERVVLVKAVKPQTLSNYGAGCLRFTQFCNAFNIPEDPCMPSLLWSGYSQFSSQHKVQAQWGVVL